MWCILLNYQFTLHNMAQSAEDSRKRPQYTSTLLLRSLQSPHLYHGRNGQHSGKLEILAKEGIRLETLLKVPSTGNDYPRELNCGEAFEHHSQATERDRKVRIGIL